MSFNLFTAAMDYAAFTGMVVIAYSCGAFIASICVTFIGYQELLAKITRLERRALQLEQTTGVVEE